MSEKLMKRLTILFAFVVLISVAVIYFTFDIRALEYLTMFKPQCILLALGCLAVGLFFDGLRLITLADVTGAKLTLKQVVNVVLSNYFLALVVPLLGGVTWISTAPTESASLSIISATATTVSSSR